MDEKTKEMKLRKSSGKHNIKAGEYEPYTPEQEEALQALMDGKVVRRSYGDHYTRYKFYGGVLMHKHRESEWRKSADGDFEWLQWLFSEIMQEKIEVEPAHEIKIDGKTIPLSEESFNALKRQLCD